jgi:hypothetical protein
MSTSAASGAIRTRARLTQVSRIPTPPLGAITLDEAQSPDRGLRVDRAGHVTLRTNRASACPPIPEPPYAKEPPAPVM